MGPDMGRFTEAEDAAMDAPSPSTEAGHTYFGYLGATFSFVSDLRLVADHFDELETELVREQLGVEGARQPGRAAATLAQFWWVLDDMLLVRVLDNYLSYLSEISPPSSPSVRKCCAQATQRLPSTRCYDTRRCQHS